MLLACTLAEHLGVESVRGPLPDQYERAVAADPNPHFIEVHVAPGESPLLKNCRAAPPVAACATGWHQITAFVETDDILAYASHEVWELASARLNGVRLEMIPKAVFAYPELLIGTPDCPPLGEILVRSFRKIAAEIPTGHPASGFYPGTVPLSGLSLFVSGIETLNLDEACAFVTTVFAGKRGESAFLAAIGEACRARGIIR
jgi:hypothetical protein